MINVTIHKAHLGYHYELMRHPPRGIKYCYLEKAEKVIPIEAIFNSPNNWQKFTQIGWFNRNYNSIPYFPSSIKLIHSHGLPIVNKIPHVIDIGFFLYPFLIDTYTFERIKRLGLPSFILPHTLTPKINARLKASKILLGSKFCKRILPWSLWCKRYITDFIDDPEIIKKVELLYPAVHNANYRRERRKNITLLYVGGNLGSFERKGGDEVLSAFDVLRRHYRNIELIFVGLIPEEIRKRYGKVNNITFYRHLGKRALFSVYKKSDIFVLPTRFDSFCFTLLEAMNFGLPVVTTKGPLVPASAEIINDGVSGFLIERRNSTNQKNIAGTLDFDNFISKLKLLIENKKLREEMGESGKEEIVSGKFSLQKRNKRLKEIYEEAYSQ